MAEAFGRALSNVYLDQTITRILVARNLPNITHQKYVDDMILPGKSTILEASDYKSIINSYMMAFGQKVNEAKSEIFFINMKK